MTKQGEDKTGEGRRHGAGAQAKRRAKKRGGKGVDGSQRPKGKARKEREPGEDDRGATTRWGRKAQTGRERIGGGRGGRNVDAEHVRKGKRTKVVRGDGKRTESRKPKGKEKTGRAQWPRGGA